MAESPRVFPMDLFTIIFPNELRPTDRLRR